MKRLAIATMIAGGLWVGGDAFGHGGSYRGPGDVVPPAEGGGPGTPGPNSGGPTTGPGGGPVTPGGGRGPSTPGGPGGPGTGGGAAPRGPSTGGFGRKNANRGEGFEQWQFWWEYNKDRYLNLRDSLGRAGSSTVGSGFLHSFGRTEEVSFASRPEEGDIFGRMVPALREALGESDADIVDSAVLAMARMVRADRSAEVFGDIVETMKNSNSSVKQSAILSLGVLGSKEAVPALVDIVNDTAAGRKLLGLRNATSSMQRSFAAISLGFIGAPESIATLHDVVTENDSSNSDLRSSAILALGLFEQGKEEVVPFLMDLLKDEKLNRVTRAQVPIALARLGDVAYPAVPELVKILKGRKANDRLEESVCVALGQLAGPADREVIETLMKVIGDSNNEQARHFSFISLAQIAGVAAKDGNDQALLSQIVNRFLLKELTKPKRKTHRPWAGLALALIGREAEVSSPMRSLVVTKLHEAFTAEKNPSHKSSFAVGLGLLKAGGEPAKEIYNDMLDTRDLELKGYLALSLGMQSYTDASKTLNGLVLDNRDPKMRLQVATALGLMGDREALGTLLLALRDAETLSVISSLAKAIGLIGDKEAIEPLLELAADAKAPGLARAFGCVALGLVGEKTNLPWNVAVTENANYRTVLAPLYEIADIL